MGFAYHKELPDLAGVVVRIAGPAIGLDRRMDSPDRRPGVALSVVANSLAVVDMQVDDDSTGHVHVVVLVLVTGIVAVAVAVAGYHSMTCFAYHCMPDHMQIDLAVGDRCFH